MKQLSLRNAVLARRISRRAPLRLLAALALAWAVLVLASYYQQLWRLLLGSGWGALVRFTGLLPCLGAILLLLAASVATALSMGRRRGQRSSGRREWLSTFALFALGGLVYLGLTLASAKAHIDPTLPFLGLAMRREVAGVGGAILLLIAASALGLGMSQALGWRYDTWRERLPFAASLGIGAFAYLGLALAMAGLYRPAVLRLVVGMVLLGAAIAVAIRGGGRGLQLPTPHLPRGTARIWIACVALAVLCAGVAALAPESQFDALWYHLAYPQRFLEAGRLVDLPSDYVSLYPMTTELWFGYGLAFGGATAAILLHFACLLLVAIATYELARRFARSASPWLAVALLVTIPTVIWEGSTAYIDLALMLYVTLALYALLRYVESSRRQWLLLAALNLGFALASKHLALFALALFCTGLTLALRLQRIRWRTTLMAVLVLMSLSLLLALPWYLRSYLASGNPVFETLYAVFGAPPERWNMETEAGLQRFLAEFGRPRTVPNLLTLPWHMTIHAADYGGTLGPLFLVLLPLLALRRMRGVLPWLVAFVGLFVVLWALPLSSFQMRHLMPIVPALAVLGASAFGRAAALARATAGRRVPTLLSAGLAVLLVLNLPPFTFLHEVDREGWNGWLTSVLHVVPLGVVIGGESADAYLTRQVRSYAVWQFAEATLPSSARVLTWSGGEQLYTHHDRIWANSAPAIATAWAETGEEKQALTGLRELGITHLIVDRRPPDSPDPWGAYALTGPVARAAWYEQLYADPWYVLYRVRWEALDRDG